MRFQIQLITLMRIRIRIQPINLMRIRMRFRILPFILMWFLDPEHSWEDFTTCYVIAPSYLGLKISAHFVSDHPFCN